MRYSLRLRFGKAEGALRLALRATEKGVRQELPPMDMDHISSPNASNDLNTGRYRLINKGFLKSNPKRFFQRNESFPSTRLETDYTTLDQRPELSAETAINTEVITKSTFPLYRQRSGSTSSPSLVLSLGGYESSNPQLRHQPSFPVTNSRQRPLLSRLTLHTGTPQVPDRNLPIIGPLSPIDLTQPVEVTKTKPYPKLTIRAKEDYVVANMDASEGSLNYGKPSGGTAYGMNSNISAAAGNMQNPSSIYQHIHELAAKRVSTLDYLRKA